MPPNTPPQRNEVIEWYKSLPVVTRFLLSAMVTTTTASSLGFVNPSTLIYYWPEVKQRLQLWRLVSCFFVNKLSLDFAFNAYFFYTNSLQLETQVFQNQPADYVFFHLFTGGLQLIAAHTLDLYVLSDGILLSTIYLLSQHFRDTPVWFMFGIRLKVKKKKRQF
ncbi:Derlin [Sporodiniella umbellata]|nr:Derlin [Sporodiniella umbellata]